MKKKIVASLIIIAFVIITVLSFFFVFSVKEIKTTFRISYKTQDAFALTDSLQSFKGKNLLFLDTKEIEKEISKNVYFEIKGIKKTYPNVIEVDIQERLEIYCLEVDEYTYVISEDGYVLSKTLTSSWDGQGKKLISLKLDGEIQKNLTLGEKISLTDSVISAFDLSKKAELTDSIESLSIDLEEQTSGRGKQTVLTFLTNTGVEIIVFDILNKGEEKLELGFNKYDEEKSDYVKSKDKIEVYEKDGGELVAVWTKR